MSVTAISSNKRYKHEADKPVRRVKLEEELGVKRTTIFEYLKLGMPHIKTRSQNLFEVNKCKAWLTENGLWTPYADGGLSDPVKEEN